MIDKGGKGAGKGRSRNNQIGFLDTTETGSAGTEYVNQYPILRFASKRVRKAHREQRKRQPSEVLEQLNIDPDLPLARFTIEEDDSTYIGQTKEGTDDVPEGFGSLITKEGAVYEGNWKNGKQSGFGRWIHPEG